MRGEGVKVLFFPCTLDGLPRHSGSAKIRCEWVAKYWEGADVFGQEQHHHLMDYDLYIFQKAYLTSDVQGFIRAFAQRRNEGGKCRLAFDLVDPDFLDDEHRRRMLDMLPLFDFAVASTEPLADWLRIQLPTYIIPDRVDLDDLPKAQHTSNGKDKPTLVWAGYASNLEQVRPMAEAVNGLGLDLTIFAPDQPVPFDIFWGKVSRFDLLLNPRSSDSPWRYKGDNKTIIAWAMGMPVARTPEELRRLCNPAERTREILARREQVNARWLVRQSVAEWIEIAAKYGIGDGEAQEAE